jgi:hypothetical protein
VGHPPRRWAQQHRRRHHRHHLKHQPRSGRSRSRRDARQNWPAGFSAFRRKSSGRF